MRLIYCLKIKQKNMINVQQSSYKCESNWKWWFFKL